MRLLLTVFALVFAFLLADLMVGRGAEPASLSFLKADSGNPSVISFNHSLHGDSLGIDCATCHTGSRSKAHAYFPSKKDCLDCHRLPLTENPGIDSLSEALAKAPEHPWERKSTLPSHVVFHHGVHAAAGVTCESCHGDISKNRYGGEHFNMKFCIQCHRGETFMEKGFRRASTDCATCHR